MVKKICDMCYHETKKLNRVIIPVPKKVIATGGIGSVPNLQMSEEAKFVEKEICDLCSTQMMKALIMMKFMEV